MNEQKQEKSEAEQVLERLKAEYNAWKKSRRPIETAPMPETRRKSKYTRA